MTRIPRRAFLLAAGMLFLYATLCAQNHPVHPIVFSDQERPIVEQLRRLRSLSGDERPSATKQLAIQIRQLPVTANKDSLAYNLANLATEGDPGPGTLQEVETTLAEALREKPIAAGKGQPAMPYLMLAQLVRYEHVQISLDDPQFAAAMSKLEEDDKQRQSTDFTLTDLTGKNWTLKHLRGQVVLINFWATWCPPCRKEMPDLETLYRRFGQQGLVILAISDEEASKVEPFIAEHKVSYPILLDPGRKVNEQFRVEGIPLSFVYDRDGKLVAQAIDMRTQKQFLAMLAQAGMQ